MTMTMTTSFYAKVNTHCFNFEATPLGKSYVFLIALCAILGSIMANQQIEMKIILALSGVSNTGWLLLSTEKMISWEIFFVVYMLNLSLIIKDSKNNKNRKKNYYAFLPWFYKATGDAPFRQLFF